MKAVDDFLFAVPSGMDSAMDSVIDSVIDPAMGFAGDAAIHSAPDTGIDSVIDTAIDAACAAVAPTWPLDRFIAVNPYWGWVDRPFEQAAQHLSHLTGTRLYMPRSYYRKAWNEKAFRRAHLTQALADCGLAATPDHAIAALDLPPPPASALRLLSDVVDASRDLTRAPAWRDTITHELSQFCAASFDAHQADWHVAPRVRTSPLAPAGEATLFSRWRETVSRDHGIALLMHAPEVAARAALLPRDPRAAIAFTLKRLVVPAAGITPLLTAVLLRINGWAAWCAYLRWQARLENRDDHHLVDLLAMRLSWEFLLDNGKRDAGSFWMQWQQTLQSESSAAGAADYDAAYQRALELASQQELIAALEKAIPQGSTKADAISNVDAHTDESASAAALSVQAVFCIDVRSEVFRRALETAAPDVQTMGFAGFFGLPISYTPLGTAIRRPQLPGLLAPSLWVSESCGDPQLDKSLARTRRSTLASKKSSRAFQRLPGSSFTLVENLGLGYLAKLVRRALPASGAAGATDDHGTALPINARPVLRFEAEGESEGKHALEQSAALAARVLDAMNLRGSLARIVLLAGHGSQSANNPHAAGLNCGACGGQSGEINARALALLLNHAAVRNVLAQQGRPLPASTHFLAALHNTTTDEVQLFDTDLLPSGHADDLARLRTALDKAGTLARTERASSLGLAALAGQSDALMRALKNRAHDWSQTRPEWGLVNNAAFIVAPRSRTRNINLQGRAFLHDYDCKRDSGHGMLEQIMTAPMIVTHWISMQYYASTVDNLRYGSGNKILHNVVGGHIGVFEGNGGDLRIGLPMQSLHDGEKWRHTPLRLSVFIEAPRDGIEMVARKHALVRKLIDHRWLFLFRIDPHSGQVERYSNAQWFGSEDQLNVG